MPDFGRWNNGGGDPSLNEINRTDQFLDALAGQQPVYATDRGEADLARLLAGWRDDVRETPMNDVLSLQDAAAALDRVASPGRRRRVSLAVVGSAAAAVLCLGGFGAVIAGSGPGDALYGLRTVLFGEQAQTRDDAVALAAQTEMQQVQKLIEQGDWQGAQAKLQAVTTTVATVGDDQRKAELVSQWQELTVKVEAQDPAATVPPGAPLPTFPVVSVDPNAVLPTSPSDTTSVTSPADTTSVTSPSLTTSVTSSPVPAETTTSGEAPTSSAATPPATTTPASTTAAPPSSSLEATPSSTPAPTTRTTTEAPSTSTSAAVAPTTTTSVVVQQSTTTAAPRVTTAVPTSVPTSVVTSVAPPVVAVPSAPAVVEPAAPTTTTILPVVPVLPVVPGAPR
ncbi:anti-sigma-D factor RsdA [Mycobacterium kyogaense]|uniref:anti-sigma-D factor RsdA n=1 Tax=Mycobacterium kyogaense TaxID=2212479 RepID=UPI000DAB9059|nr:anti-sigma-D factor RsdA [Mycobacterium kyogaense]